MPKRIIIPQLAQEVIYEIFSRLPVKSLMRFKSINKQWCSLFSSPHFIGTHLQLTKSSTNSSKIITMCTLQSASIVDLEFEVRENSVVNLDYPIGVGGYTDVAFVGSCDGLVCLLRNQNVFIIWNPSTRESRQLPSPIFGKQKRGGWLYFLGFGYDSSIDDYKVVRGRSWKYCDGAKTDYEVEVFTLKSNKWKLIKLHEASHLLHSHGTLLNGNLHYIDCLENEIVPFSMKEEKFMEVVLFPPASPYGMRLSGMRLSSFEKSLFLYCAVFQYVEVWERKEYGVDDSWTRRYRVSLAVLPFAFINSLELYITRKGKFVVGVYEERMEMYDLEENTCRNLSSPVSDDCWILPNLYEDTLVSPRES